jgi:UDP-N-acetylmuramate dehydrogenase
MNSATVGALERLDALAAKQNLELRADVALAPLTTLRVGGPADRLAAPSSVEDVVALLRLAADAGVPTFMLGKGSDIVVADAGVRGLVIRT